MSDLLDGERIRYAIAAHSYRHLDNIEVFDAIDSTNTYLLKAAQPTAGRYRLALAEQQTAGRGRRGARWQSPPTSGICLSMSYTFESRPTTLSCLTLATGVAIANALTEIGAHGVGLKWPNDLIANNRKLGGVLVEARVCKSAPVNVVIGVGINVDLSEAISSQSADIHLRRATDLARCIDLLPSRNELCALLIGEIFSALVSFEANGFSDFAVTWDDFDWLLGKRVTIEQEDRPITGLCHGIDNAGALLIEGVSGCDRVTNGTVTFVGGIGRIARKPSLAVDQQI